MTHKINETLGKDLGLTGRYADMPAFLIVNKTHDFFLNLTSRLIDLEYGPQGDALAGHPLWAEIEEERAGLSERLETLGGDAVRAVQLTEDIQLLERKIDGLVAAVTPERLGQ